MEHTLNDNGHDEFVDLVSGGAPTTVHQNIVGRYILFAYVLGMISTLQYCNACNIKEEKVGSLLT